VTLTREALCSVVYCPEPRNPDWHHCLLDGGNVIHHHHVVSRGMGGSKRRKIDKAGVVPLCPRHHEEVTLHKWTDEIRETSVGRYYVQIREHDAQSWLLASTGEGDPAKDGRERGALKLPSPAGVSASGPTLQGWQPPEPAKATEPETVVGGGVARTPSVAPPPYSFHENGIEFEEEYTLNDWRKAAREITRESKGRQWRVGDLVNAERWAECSQDYDEIDYPPETQANYGRIAAAYKLAERRSLSFGHHQAVYKHEERLSLLDEAVANGWTRKELREAAYPDTAVRPKRFSVEELREAAEGFWCAEAKNNGRRFLAAFLEWLGERESKPDSDG
jgi:hypothetical protein